MRCGNGASDDRKSYRLRGRWLSLFCGVDGEGDGPEAVVVCSLGVIVEDLPRLAELVSFDVQLMKEVRVKWYVQDGPQARRVAFLRHAALGARGPPGPLEGVDVTLPSATGADGAPHILLEAGGHGLLGRVGLRLDVQHRVLGRVPRLDREEPRINRGFSLDAELAKI